MPACETACEIVLVIIRNGRKKPALKRIADPELMKAESDLLKVPAQIKHEEDLAPQKIKGLKYLAKVGCGCNGADVQKAILAGLADCVPEVRKEAINVIHAAVKKDSCEACGNKRKRRKLLPCIRCRGCGCDCCNQCGQVECEVSCESCSACGACCGKEIQEMLKEMAFEQDDNGCWVEPVEEIREAAATALGLCPPLPEEEEEPETPPVTGEGGATGEGDAEDKNEDNEENPQSIRDTGIQTHPWSHAASYDSQISTPYAEVPIVQGEVLSAPGTEQVMTIGSSNMAAGTDMGNAPQNAILGSIDSILDEPGTFWVALQENYELPVGATLMIGDYQGIQVMAVVEQTGVGRFQVRLTEEEQTPNQFTTIGQQIYAGIVSL